MSCFFLDLLSLLPLFYFFGEGCAMVAPFSVAKSSLELLPLIDEALRPFRMIHTQHIIDCRKSKKKYTSNNV